MDNSSDNKHDVTLDRPTSADSAQGPETNRRRFARNALVGGAVFVSLGNRAAWGAVDPDNPCVSTPSFLSLTPNNPLLSYDPATADPERVATYDKVTSLNTNGNDYIEESNQTEVCPLAADETAGDAGSEIGDKTMTFKKFIKDKNNKDNKNNW